MEKPRQLPLELSHGTGYSRDDLIVSPANEEAVALIDRWPEWPAPVVVFAGPPGCGKTHLASIWREETGAIQLNGATLGAAVADLDGPVLIDSIDAAPVDEAGLFHLINTVRGAGTQLLITARRFPSAWGITLPDLESRLKAAATIEIQEPDDLLLTGVVTKLFADRQIEVEPHVVQYLVRRIERSLSTAIRVVDRLDRKAMELKARITRALAAETISALDKGQRDFDI